MWQLWCNLNTFQPVSGLLARVAHRRYRVGCDFLSLCSSTQPSLWSNTELIWKITAVFSAALNEALSCPKSQIVKRERREWVFQTANWAVACCGNLSTILKHDTVWYMLYLHGSLGHRGDEHAPAIRVAKRVAILLPSKMQVLTLEIESRAAKQDTKTY